MKNNYCDYIAELLTNWGKVNYKNMFSGFGLYKSGQIFAIVCDDMLYLKADKQSQPLLESKGSEQFIYISNKAKNKKAKMSYWSVPQEFFDSPEKASYWAEIAYQAGLRSNKNSKHAQKTI